MKYILIAATALFVFSSGNAQIDKINSAKEKAKQKFLKGKKKFRTKKKT